MKLKLIYLLKVQPLDSLRWRDQRISFLKIGVCREECKAGVSHYIIFWQDYVLDER